MARGWLKLQGKPKRPAIRKLRVLRLAMQQVSPRVMRPASQMRPEHLRQPPMQSRLVLLRAAV
jgi:hypothetical protein